MRSCPILIFHVQNFAGGGGLQLLNNSPSSHGPSSFRTDLMTSTAASNPAASNGGRPQQPPSIRSSIDMVRVYNYGPQSLQQTNPIVVSLDKVVSIG